MANLPADSETRQESDRITAEYLERLHRLLRRAPQEIREDALREVQSHIEDEWRVLGGGISELRTVLERLGPPEEYGRDLALQLILLHSGRRLSPARLAVAVIFWASTSLIGVIVLISGTLAFAFAFGMLTTAIYRVFGGPMMLIDTGSYQFFNLPGLQLRFPPMTWSPALIGLVGLLPAIIIFAGLYRFLSLWVRSRLGQTGLILVIPESSSVLPPGWESHALLAMFSFAILGLGGFMFFTRLGGLLPIVRPANVRLPFDFFPNLLTVLALISSLVFLISPFLGLLWAAKKTTSKILQNKKLPHG